MAPETDLGLPPDTLLANRYRILTLLGMGGMGRVYLAEDEKLETRVAIKVLREVLSRDPGSVKRLIAEARHSMVLSHPNVVRAHNFEDGELVKFLIMEYIEGETLAGRLAARDKLDEAEARRIAIDTCKGLEHAHEQKVIHRDVKPANIMLAKNGAVKIADFGIARECRDSFSRLTSQVDSGTLLYMSPEQLIGKSNEGSDVYSLGVVLYEMLAGQPPFRSGDITYQIREIAPDPPEGISPEISAIVMKCLEKKPEGRFGSVGELREELDGTADKARAEARGLEARKTAELQHERQEQERQEKLRARVKALVDDGNWAFARDDYVTAISKWAAALELSPSEPGLIEAIRGSRQSLAEQEDRKRQSDLEAEDRKAQEARKQREETRRKAAEEGKRAATGLAADAVALLDRGSYDEAEAKLREALNRDPACAEATAALDRCHTETVAGEARKQRDQRQSTPPPLSKTECGRQAAVWFVAFSIIVIAIWIISSMGGKNQGSRSATAKMVFVTIPAGKFVMGCSAGDSQCDGDENPRHEVTISRGFELGKHEVSQGQCAEVMGNNPSHFKGDDRLPVEQVSWNDAQAFIAKLNSLNDGYRYHLPTEAEWEYAARAGSAAQYYGELNAVAWFNDNSGSKTHTVGQKQANGFGLHDMLGNVWEWCADWYGEGYYGSSPATDPKGPSSGQYRVLRGGSWNFVSGVARASSRSRSDPDFRTSSMASVCAGRWGGVDRLPRPEPRRSRSQRARILLPPGRAPDAGQQQPASNIQPPGPRGSRQAKPGPGACDYCFVEINAHLSRIQGEIYENEIRCTIMGRFLNFF